MSVESTLCIIKPDAVDHKDKINVMMAKNGLEVVTSEKIRLTEGQAKEFYREHKEQGFFNELITFMISGDIIIQVLRGENAVVAWRTLIGPTNPKEAPNGTVRGDFGNNKKENAVHGSDNKTSAAREISLFFNEDHGQYALKDEFKHSAP
jgi:nucleoside-diphosphate kinase